MIRQQCHTNVKGSYWRHYQGSYFFEYKDIKQGIGHTLLMEEHSVSTKWVIIMDRRQDSNANSTPACKNGPSAQDRYCARGLGGGAKARRGNGE